MFEMLARDDAYREQPYKFDAQMELAKWYKSADPKRSKKLLEQLILYKDYINVNDKQYNDAKEMLKALGN